MFRSLLCFSLLIFVLTTVSAADSESIVDESLPLTIVRSDESVSVSTVDLSLSSISTEAELHQRDLFQTIVSVNFDNSSSVGDAVSRVVRFIGYELYVGGRGIDKV